MNAVVSAIESQTAMLIEAIKNMSVSPHVQSVQWNGQGEMDKITPVIIDGETYTSPKLMQVIKWLQVNPDKRDLTVRDIATLTGVSKSWVAIAKKYKGG